MASDETLIPCDRCSKFVSFSDYEAHSKTHESEALDANTLYNDGNMYSQPSIGPLPKPSGYKDPHPDSVVTNDDYNNSAYVEYDYGDGNMYGGSKEEESKGGSSFSPKSGAKSNDDSKSNNVLDDEKKNEIQDITEDAGNCLRDNGCVIIKNGVRNDLSKTALQIINNALAEGPSCLLEAEYRKNDDILDLWNESAAFSLSQNVLGLTNVVIPTMADIQLIFPEKPSDNDEETKATEWTIDGLDALDEDELAPYTVGMRVVLSKQSFTFYKGTHLAVFAMLQKEGINGFMEKNQTVNDRKPWNIESNPMMKWEVERGDIILYHPYLCVPADIRNVTENIDYFVDFKVKHKKFSSEVARRRAQHLWLGYEKLVYALNGEQLTI